MGCEEAEAQAGDGEGVRAAFIVVAILWTFVLCGGIIIYNLQFNPDRERCISSGGATACSSGGSLVQIETCTDTRTTSTITEWVFNESANLKNAGATGLPAPGLCPTALVQADYINNPEIGGTWGADAKPDGGLYVGFDYQGNCPTQWFFPINGTIESALNMTTQGGSAPPCFTGPLPACAHDIWCIASITRGNIVATIALENPNTAGFGGNLFAEPPLCGLPCISVQWQSVGICHEQLYILQAGKIVLSNSSSENGVCHIIGEWNA